MTMRRFADNLCGQVIDALVDACAAEGLKVTFACGKAIRSKTAMTAGEFTTQAQTDYEKIVRQSRRPGL